MAQQRRIFPSANVASGADDEAVPIRKAPGPDAVIYQLVLVMHGLGLVEVDLDGVVLGLDLGARHRQAFAVQSTTARSMIRAFHQDQETVRLQRQMMDASERCYLLSDNSKFTARHCISKRTWHRSRA